eukprot:tig00001067_g6769.t1
MASLADLRRAPDPGGLSARRLSFDPRASENPGAGGFPSARRQSTVDRDTVDRDTVAVSFVPDVVLERYMSSPEDRWPSRESGEERAIEAASVFIDTSGFTKMSEKLSPEDVAVIMNKLFGRMIMCVHEHRGDVLKFLGDALLCSFTEEPETAVLRALAAATAIQEAVASLGGRRRRRWRRRTRGAAEPAGEPAPAEGGGRGGASGAAGTLYGARRASRGDLLSEARGGATTRRGLGLEMPQDEAGPGLRVKIGIGTGTFYCTHVGGEGGRWEFLVTGPALSACLLAEGAAAPSQTILTREAYGRLPEGACRAVLLSEDGENTVPLPFPEAGDALYRVLEFLPPPAPALALRPRDWRRGAALAGMEAARRERVRAALEGYVTNASPELLLAENRTASVLFIALFGLEAAEDAQEAEAGGPGAPAPRPALGALHGAVRAVQGALAEHEGSLRQVVSDDKGSVLLAAFGLPGTAHGFADDAGRAVGTALEAKRRLEDMDLECSIGICTGRVFCGLVGDTSSVHRAEYAMVGSVVNKAARLMGRAGKEILVDETTHAATAKLFKYKELPPLSLKGIAEPVKVFMPTRPRDRRMSVAMGGPSSMGLEGLGAGRRPSADVAPGRPASTASGPSASEGAGGPSRTHSQRRGSQTKSRSPPPPTRRRRRGRPRGARHVTRAASTAAWGLESVAAVMRGRAQETEAIHAALAAVAGGGAGAAPGAAPASRLILVEAEAGMGKSRVVREACRRGEELGFRVVCGAASEMERGAPYLQWRPLLLALFRSEGDTLPALDALASPGPARPRPGAELPRNASFTSVHSWTDAAAEREREKAAGVRGARVRSLRFARTTSSGSVGPVLASAADALGRLAGIDEHGDHHDGASPHSPDPRASPGGAAGLASTLLASPAGPSSAPPRGAHAPADPPGGRLQPRLAPRPPRRLPRAAAGPGAPLAGGGCAPTGGLAAAGGELQVGLQGARGGHVLAFHAGPREGPANARGSAPASPRLLSRSASRLSDAPAAAEASPHTSLPRRARRVAEARLLELLPAAMAPKAALLNDLLDLRFEAGPLVHEMGAELRAQNLTAMLLALLRAACAGPTLLVLEDSHWADSASLALTAALAAEAVPQLCILATFRTDEAPAREAAARLAGGEGAPRVRVALGPLSREETRAQVADRLLGSEPPDALVEFLYAKAQGRPLFTEELLSMLLEKGAVRLAPAEPAAGAGAAGAPGAGGIPELSPLGGEAGAGAGAGALSPGAEGRRGSVTFELETAQSGGVLASLPDSLQGVIVARIDRLDASQQLALKVAAVLGRCFDSEVLWRVYPMPVPREALLDDLDSLAEADFIHPDEDEGEGGGGEGGVLGAGAGQAFVFKHQLVVDVAYHLLLKSQAQAVHARVGEFIEEQYGTEDPDYYALLAHHFEAADVAPKAVEYLSKGAEEAARAHAGREVIALAARALAIAPGAHPAASKARLALRLGEAHFATGSMAACREHLEAALALLGRPFPRTRGGMGLGVARQVAVQALQRAAPRRWVAGRRAGDPDVSTAVGCYDQLAQACFLQGDVEGQLLAMLTALNLAERLGSPVDLARSFANAAATCAVLKLFPTARSYLRRARDALAQAGEGAVAAWTYVALCACMLHYCAGEWAALVEVGEEGFAAAQRLCYMRREGELCSVTGSAEMQWRTPLAVSRARFASILAVATKRGDSVVQGWAHAELLDIGAMTGDTDVWRRELKPFQGLLAAGKFSGYPRLQARTAIVTGEERLARGDAFSAVSALQGALALLEPLRQTEPYAIQLHLTLCFLALRLWIRARGEEAEPQNAAAAARLVARAERLMRQYAGAFELGAGPLALVRGVREYYEGVAPAPARPPPRPRPAVTGKASGAAEAGRRGLETVRGLALSALGAAAGDAAAEAEGASVLAAKGILRGWSPLFPHAAYPLAALARAREGSITSLGSGSTLTSPASAPSAFSGASGSVLFRPSVAGSV